MTTPNTADRTSDLLPPKKTKVYQTKFATAHRACRTAKEREQLALIMKAGWTEAELNEYARIYYFRSAKDYPTASSYRSAIEDLGEYYARASKPDAKPSECRLHKWLKAFRKGGCKPLPPRREALLKRGRGNGPEVGPDEYAWPEHTEEFRSLIEQRCRDYFKISPDRPVHPNAWAASHRAYHRELAAKAEAARQATFTLMLSPKVLKKSKTKGQRRKIISSYDASFWGGTLKRHFDYHFKHHTPEFREEVAALARKDHGLRPNAYISPTRWKAACNKHFYLIESPNL